MSNDPKFPLVGNNEPPSDPKERNQLMKEGIVVEYSTTPMNGSMVCYNPKLHYPCLPGIRPTHCLSLPKPC
jgi:hypothetical protein